MCLSLEEVTLIGCAMCHFDFNSLDQLEKHIGKQHVPKQETAMNSKMFNTRTQKVGSDDFSMDPTTGRFACKACNQSYSTKQSLQHHVSSKHSLLKTKNQTCPLCPRSFSNHVDLSDHILANHNTKSIFQNVSTKGSVESQYSSSNKQVLAIDKLFDNVVKDTVEERENSQNSSSFKQAIAIDKLFDNIVKDAVKEREKSQNSSSFQQAVAMNKLFDNVVKDAVKEREKSQNSSSFQQAVATNKLFDNLVKEAVKEHKDRSKVVDLNRFKDVDFGDSCDEIVVDPEFVEFSEEEEIDPPILVIDPPDWLKMKTEKKRGHSKFDDKHSKVMKQKKDRTKNKLVSVTKLVNGISNDREASKFDFTSTESPKPQVFAGFSLPSSKHLTITKICKNKCSNINNNKKSHKCN